jgi:hypothetical protein
MDLSSSAQLMKLVSMGSCGPDWSGSGQGQVESSCEFGIEPSGFINCWETIEVSKQLGISRVVFSSMELVSFLETSNP